MHVGLRGVLGLPFALAVPYFGATRSLYPTLCLRISDACFVCFDFIGVAYCFYVKHETFVLSSLNI